MSRVVIFANGSLPSLDKTRAILRAEDVIIAADGGTRHALALGRIPHLIVGDLDSMTEEERQAAKAGNIRLIEYSPAKDETDLELAVNHALELKPEQVIIAAALGGRLDQTLGNLALLGDARLAGLDVRVDDGVEEIFFCRNQAQVRGRSGDTVSLIPWQGAAEGIRTENLKWPLHNETLYPHKTRGISNEMLADTAAISIASGLLLVVHRRNS